MRTVVLMICLAGVVGIDAAQGAGRGIVIEDFEAGQVVLQGYPGQDQDPTGWSLTDQDTYDNSAWSLELTGNTWKIEAVSPHALADSTVWQVAVRCDDLAEMHGFGVGDGQHELFYTFWGEDLPASTNWWTVYQGAFARDGWRLFLLPLGRDWFATFGYLPTVDRLIFVNDGDDGPAGATLFDAIADVTEDQPRAPRCRILYTIEGSRKVAKDLFQVDVQFHGKAFDPEGGALVYHWDFGDSSTSEATDPPHQFLVHADHPYTVSLAVTDPDGFAAGDTCQIQVQPGPAEGPLDRQLRRRHHDRPRLRVPRRHHRHAGRGGALRADPADLRPGRGPQRVQPRDPLHDARHAAPDQERRLPQSSGESRGHPLRRRRPGDHRQQPHHRLRRDRHAGYHGGSRGTRHPVQRRGHQRVLCSVALLPDRTRRAPGVPGAVRPHRPAVQLPAVPRRRLRQARFRVHVVAQPRGGARRLARPRRHRHRADPQRRGVRTRPARRRPCLDGSAARRGERGGRRPARVPLPQRALARRARPAAAGPGSGRRRGDQPPPARAAGLRILRRQAHRPQPGQLRLRPLVPRDHAHHGADARGPQGRHRGVHLHPGLDRRLDPAACQRRSEPRDHRPPRRLLAADECPGGAGLRRGPRPHPPRADRGRFATGGHAALHRPRGEQRRGRLAAAAPARRRFPVGGGASHRRRGRLGGALGARDPVARRLRGRGRHVVGRELERRVARRDAGARRSAQPRAAPSARAGHARGHRPRTAPAVRSRARAQRLRLGAHRRTPGRRC